MPDEIKIDLRLNSELDRLMEGTYERQRAMAWLMVGLINDHFPHPDEVEELDEQLGTGGCVINCGPCGALKWFSDNARVQLEDYVRLTGFQGGGGWCYWDSERDGLRWDWFEAFWAGHKACWTNGIVSGCRHEDDETGYLLGSDANARRLLESVERLEGRAVSDGKEAHVPVESAPAAEHGFDEGSVLNPATGKPYPRWAGSEPQDPPDPLCVCGEPWLDDQCSAAEGTGTPEVGHG